MSQTFQDIECFTDLNVFKYSFNVIQNWETDALQFYLIVLIFIVEGDESSRLKDGQLAGGFGRLLALVDSPDFVTNSSLLLLLWRMKNL